MYYATMNERISFCIFWSCVLRETCVVDYTDIERVREKKGNSITCGPLQREEI
jgi:hypothetical protein